MVMGKEKKNVRIQRGGGKHQNRYRAHFNDHFNRKFAFIENPKLSNIIYTQLHYKGM